MSDESPEAIGRARRARRAAADDDASGPDATDDTAADPSAPARRGWQPDTSEDEPDTSPEADAKDASDEETPQLSQNDEHVPDTGHSAFMRPSSGAPAEPVRPVERVQDDQPAPRRSASSSATPPSAPSFTAPAATAGAGVITASEHTGDEVEADEISTKAPRSPWPMRVLAGALVLALVAGAVYLAIRQVGRNETSVTVTQTPSAGVSASVPTAVTDESLLTAAEAEAALGGAPWQVSQTLTEVLPSSPQVTCMTNPQGLPNAQATRQRVLGGKGDGLAALHRLDAYANETLAQQAYQTRLAKLSACDDVPALLDSAATVAGLADESFAMTIAYQDPTVQYRTVVLSRTGTSVSMLDVARNKEKVDPAKVAAAMVAPSKRLCSTAGGTCPTDLNVRPEVVPPTPIFGWLAQSDIPRITPGQGIWSATEVAKVITKGSQCENMTLASVTGPTEREQRSYLLDQDDAAPEGFGVDQVRFLFKDDAGARGFADKLGKDIAACSQRSSTATVSEARNLSITGQNRQPVSGRIFLVTQKTGNNSEVQFRVAVVVSGNRVTYLVSNTRKNFDFSTDAWLLLSARAGQRITQSR